MKPLFTGKDLQIMQALAHDPSCVPAFESFKAILVWKDERAEGLTPEAYKNLCDLWIARSFLYHGRNFADYGDLLDPQYFKDKWARGVAQVSDWPGFKRLALSDKDKSYYETCMREQAEALEL